MKNFCLLLYFTGTLIWIPAGAQDLEKVAFKYFQGVRAATQQHYDLWNMDLYGPMILWELWLNDGYKLVKDDDSANYTIVEEE